MIEFLKQLFEDGEVVVPRNGEDDSESVRKLLIFAERIWREDWPGTAPAFDVNVAEKAAEILLLLCQSTVYRELDEHHVAERLQQIDLVVVDSPSSHYSADLLLRFLPQVSERLMRTSSDDPIMKLVRQAGQTWPLSAVGISNCVPTELPQAFNDAGLFRVFVDRIIAVADEKRLALPGVVETVEASLGPFADLRSATGLTEALRRFSEDETTIREQSSD